MASATVSQQSQLQSSQKKVSQGVRRLLMEAAEMEAEQSPDLTAQPLEDDLFTWHFTIRGPGGDFEGGVYHGKLVLPPTYPFAPPEVYMLTPSGRFETNKKICLSISNFHPESWQPSWGIRTALVALMAFFSSEPKGAVGSLDALPQERRRLAKCSRSFQCSSCGFDASSPDVFPSCEETPTITIDNDALSSGPSDEGTTIFPTAPLASPHVLGDGAGDAAANAIAAAPQMPVLQHRPPEPGLAIPHTGEVLAHAGGGGGGPLLVDRAILVVLLAILALIVRKF